MKKHTNEKYPTPNPEDIHEIINKLKKRGAGITERDGRRGKQREREREERDRWM
jgi:hypothetical protein